MSKYYAESLSAERLKRVYDLAPPRVQQFLEAEIEFILPKIRKHDFVLELGCGYGRVLRALPSKTANLFGADNSIDSLKFGCKNYFSKENFRAFCMDAAHLGFRDKTFDTVLCIQNGISAFKLDPLLLMKEALRVTRPAGTVLFSSYSDKFWDKRLAWFEIQAAHGLLGEIDYQKTGNGTIVCKDGFKAVTFSPSRFEEHASQLDKEYNIIEVDDSLVFCEIIA